jgi:hypothetical protein
MNKNITFQRWRIAKKKNIRCIIQRKKDLWIEQHAAGDVCVNFRQGNMHLSGQGVEYIMMKENKGDTCFLKYPSPYHNLILDYWYQEMMERSPPVLNNN